jgi:hypothetical protein
MQPWRRRSLLSPDEQPVQPEAVETDQPEPTVTQGTTTEDISPEPPTEDELLAEEEEAPAPSTIHPSAPAGTTNEDEDLAAGREEHGEYFIGLWNGIPNFGCPYCSFSTIEQGGNGLVELHTLAMIDSGELKHMAALQLKGE